MMGKTYRKPKGPKGGGYWKSGGKGPKANRAASIESLIANSVQDGIDKVIGGQAAKSQVIAEREAKANSPPAPVVPVKGPCRNGRSCIIFGCDFQHARTPKDTPLMISERNEFPGAKVPSFSKSARCTPIAVKSANAGKLVNKMGFNAVLVPGIETPHPENAVLRDVAIREMLARASFDMLDTTACLNDWGRLEDVIETINANCWNDSQDGRHYRREATQMGVPIAGDDFHHVSGSRVIGPAFKRVQSWIENRGWPEMESDDSEDSDSLQQPEPHAPDEIKHLVDPDPLQNDAVVHALEEAEAKQDSGRAAQIIDAAQNGDPLPSEGSSTENDSDSEEVVEVVETEKRTELSSAVLEDSEEYGTLLLVDDLHTLQPSHLAKWYRTFCAEDEQLSVWAIVPNFHGRSGVVARQAFYRNDENQVVAKVMGDGANSQRYGPHPACDWVFRSPMQHGSLDFIPKLEAEFEGLHVVKILIGDFSINRPRVASFHLDNPPFLKPITSKQLEWDTSFLGFLKPSAVTNGRWFTRKWVVHSRTWDKHEVAFSAIVASQNNHQMTRATINEAMGKDPEFRIFQEAYPTRANEIIRSTADALIFGQKNAEAEKLAQNSAHVYDSMSLSRRIWKGEDIRLQQSVTWWKDCAVLMAVIIGIWGLFFFVGSIGLPTGVKAEMSPDEFSEAYPFPDFDGDEFVDLPPDPDDGFTYTKEPYPGEELNAHPDGDFEIATPETSVNGDAPDFRVLFCYYWRLLWTMGWEQWNEFLFPYLRTIAELYYGAWRAIACDPLTGVLFVVGTFAMARLVLRGLFAILTQRQVTIEKWDLLSLIWLWATMQDEQSGFFGLIMMLPIYIVLHRVVFVQGLIFYHSSRRVQIATAILESYIFRMLPANLRLLVSVGLHWGFAEGSFLAIIIAGFMATLPPAWHVAYNLLVILYTELHWVGWFTDVRKQTFQSAYNAGMWNVSFIQHGIERWKLGDGLQSQDANEHYCNKKPVDERHELFVRFGPFKTDFVPRDERTDTLFPVCSNVGVPFPPTNGMHSCFWANKMRNAAYTPDALAPELWKDITDQFTSQFRFVDALCPEDVLEWANHYEDSRKKKLALEIVERYLLGDVPPEKLWAMQFGLLTKKQQRYVSTKGLSMFAKTDETLGYKEFQGVYGLKPRTIIALPIWLQYLLQPWIRSAQKRLKAVLSRDSFNGGIYDFTLKGQTKKFWFQYAGGMKGPDLSYWLRAAEALAITGVICVIVMGDDCVIVDATSGKIRYLESDYSHYDQSQKDPQVESELSVLRALGVPSGAIQLLDLISEAKSTKKSRNKKSNYSIHFIPGTKRRVTGGPNTSLSNSTNNLIGIVIASFWDWTDEGWAQTGLVSVMARHSDPCEVSFLRGLWWERTDGTRAWGWMPSASVKVGKSQRRITRPRKLKELCYGMGIGLQDIPTGMPILDEYRRTLLRMGEAGPEVYVTPESKLKITSDRGKPVVRSKIIEWMHRKYKVTEQDVLECEALLRQVTSIPCVISHPAFVKLAEGDYY